MGDIFDSLFGILPVALGIIWLLRRFGRKAGKKDEGEKKSGIRSRRERKNMSPFATVSETASGNNPQRESTLKKVLSRVAEFTETLQEQNNGSATSSAPYPGGRNIIAPQEEGTHSLVVGDSLDENEGLTRTLAVEDVKGPTTMERISGLSPLAQGMLWSTILDKPVGMKGPNE